MSRETNRCTFIPDCQLGDKWDPSSQTCILDPDYVGDCETYAEWNRVTRQCDCINGYFFSQRLQSCQEIDCKDDEKWSKRHVRCIPRSCPQFMYWDDDTVKCECNDDRFWSSRQRRCIPIYCPDGEKFNFKLEQCVKKGGSSTPTPQPQPDPTPQPRPVVKPKKPKKCYGDKALDVATNKCVCK